MDPKFTGLALRKELESNKVFKAVGTVPKNGFSQKALYRLFSKLDFFYVGEVPNASQQKSHMYVFMRNFRSKKALWKRMLGDAGNFKDLKFNGVLAHICLFKKRSTNY
jgi:hypothetical protein